MRLENCQANRATRVLSAVTALALIGTNSFLAGCGARTGQSALSDQLKELNTTQQPTAKFAGTVTIDGRPPRDAIKNGLRVLLYDPKNPPTGNMPPLNAIVNHADGTFEFTTYSLGDGAPLGSYIVLFVALKHSLMGKQEGYHQPDALRNLYNDPDKNATNPEFKVEVAPPGKSDYHFDLAIEGKDPVSPSPKAITHFN